MTRFFAVLGLLFLTGTLQAQELQPKMGEPLKALTASELMLFEAGKALFELTLQVEDGLGPIFNEDSCGSCHAQPATGGPGTQRVTRFGRAEKGATL